MRNATIAATLLSFALVGSAAAQAPTTPATGAAQSTNTTALSEVGSAADVRRPTDWKSATLAPSLSRAGVLYAVEMRSSISEGGW